jgi:lipid A ethanolaminephosphotransferase
MAFNGFSRRDPSPDSWTEHRSGWNPLTLALLAGVWIAALPNWPLWRALLALPETASARGLLFVVGFGLMLAALMTGLLALFAWRWTIKPAIAVMLVSAALGAHFMGSYGVVIDTTMMTNVLQTDPREVRDLLNWRLVMGVLMLAGLPMLALWRMRLSRTRWWPQAGRNVLALIAALAVLAALVFALFADLSATMRNHRTMRYLINPVNSFYALGDLAAQSHAKPAGPPLAIGLDARIAPRAAGALPPMLVLVIGETARADHFALNGYPRPTNPELAALDVLSFRNVMSCGTNTAASLPCMFSSLGKVRYESRERDHENLLDLVQRAGMAVLWLDGQSGCKGVCDRVPHVDACANDDCLDETLLQGLDERIAALPADARARGVLLVLHQMGSHGPAYYKRSPPDRKPFLPECTTNVLQQCERTALINGYDNSIAYTDHMLAQTIAWLQRQQARFDTTLLYVSDHGESLGENNLYLHGLPYAVAPIEQKHVPMVLWPASRAQANGQADCLRTQQTAALTHDNLFHASLGVLGITATEYNPALDMLAPCRTN